MEPQLCTSDYIFKIEEDVILSNRRKKNPISPVDGYDLARLRVNGWQRVMLTEGYNLPGGARSGRGGSGYKEEAYYIVAMPGRMGQFARPYGDPEFEFEALISF